MEIFGILGIFFVLIFSITGIVFILAYLNHLLEKGRSRLALKREIEFENERMKLLGDNHIYKTYKELKKLREQIDMQLAKLED
jgi:predicted membrane protein